MINRIAVTSKVEDARARAYLHSLKSVFPKSGLTAVSAFAVYTVDAKLSVADINKAAARLANPITETFSIGDVPAPQTYTYALEIGFLPGVTDNVGHTARETIEDCTGKKFKDGEGVYSSTLLFLHGKISAREAESFARELHNPLIERATILKNPRGDTSWNSRGVASNAFPIVVPKVKLGKVAARAEEVNLNVSDVELKKISAAGIQNRGPLALSLRAMKIIRDHFQTLRRNPTDIELESLAQTWSEHCKHTIFADPLDEIQDGLYKHYIKGATEKIRKQKTENSEQGKGPGDFCVSVFKDNSGAIAFDDKYLVTHKVETHNSPSGLDPFGGSVTAIVGVNRDCLGFGLGAKPIANTYGFFVADPHDSKELFRDKKKKQPLLSARRILEGVIKGINAGGNQSGIPTPLGLVAVDKSYRGKPLVFGGTVGLIPRKSPAGSRGSARKLYEKRAQQGDYIVMLGGRVGLDGIHGATFSSESLSAGSPATAVQIGDPITQKKFSDAIIREARDAGLYSSITDDGAGGLSGSVGEMAKESGGCEVELDKVPLKYHGLAPWQIWLSESQERMTLSVPKKNWTKLKKIFDRHDVEATVIGTFTDSGRVIVRYAGEAVMDIGLDFLHDGRPVEIQKGKKPVRKNAEPSAKERAQDLGVAMLAMLARPNIGSTSFISQQYDHEVQGTSVTKSLQGRGRVNADAGVLQPLPHSQKGVVLSHGYTPWYSQIGTYEMAAAAIDTAIRNAVCAGASRDYLAILDNFCWSSSDTPQRLHELKEAARACYDVATAYGTPFISGKDSMFNDFRGFDSAGKPVHIAALPTLLVSAIGVVADVKKAVTLDFKRIGDLVYLIGETNDELGASEYFAMLGENTGKKVPLVNTKKNAKTYDALARAIDAGLVVSATPLSRGGLAAALAKSAVAGQLGAQVDVSQVHGTARRGDAILFSESQGRILVSVRRSAQKEFERLFSAEGGSSSGGKGVALANIGEIVQDTTVSITLPETKVDLPLAALTESYRSFFSSWGGSASGGKQ